MYYLQRLQCTTYCNTVASHCILLWLLYLCYKSNCVGQAVALYRTVWVTWQRGSARAAKICKLKFVSLTKETLWKLYIVENVVCNWSWLYRLAKRKHWRGSFGENKEQNEAGQDCSEMSVSPMIKKIQLTFKIVFFLSLKALCGGEFVNLVRSCYGFVWSSCLLL